MSEQRGEPPKFWGHGRVSEADGALLERIRAEFIEMPGLQLTVQQAVRLCGVLPPVCQAVFDVLVDAKFLCRKASGAYARVTDGGVAYRTSTSLASERSPRRS